MLLRSETRYFVDRGINYGGIEIRAGAGIFVCNESQGAQWKNGAISNGKGR